MSLLEATRIEYYRHAVINMHVPVLTTKPLLLSKHEINRHPCPDYHTLIINRYSPFIQIDIVFERTFAWSGDRQEPDNAVHVPAIECQSSNNVPVNITAAAVGKCAETLLQPSHRRRQQPSQGKNDIMDLFKWLKGYVAEVAQDTSGLNQISQCLKVLTRAFTYRKNVKRSMNASQCPGT